MFIEKITGDLSQKRRWREYKSRVKALPGPYRAATSAIERYLSQRGAITKGEVLVRMLDDLASLFEHAAADGTPLRDVVGDDPVEFAETFLGNYAEGEWIAKERRRLAAAIDGAAAQQERDAT